MLNKSPLSTSVANGNRPRQAHQLSGGAIVEHWQMGDIHHKWQGNIAAAWRNILWTNEWRRTKSYYHFYIYATKIQTDSI